jgi:hypothetical protein
MKFVGKIDNPQARVAPSATREDRVGRLHSCAIWLEASRKRPTASERVRSASLHLVMWERYREAVSRLARLRGGHTKRYSMGLSFTAYCFSKSRS